MKVLLLSYSSGINAWMQSREWDWPPEFFLLRYRPEPWTLQDSLMIKGVMALILCTDYPSEVVRANLVTELGAKKALQILEEGINEPSFKTERASLSGWMEVSVPGGSNNWVLDGSRTSTGMPLLANDPHLEISLPPIWYEMHLSCPTLNVTGVSIPGVPLVIIGHNDSIAWGITSSAADVQDLYREKLNPTKDRFLDSDGWKSLRRQEEKIRIRGEKESAGMEILWTSRGPIVTPHIIGSKEPCSLQWTIYEGGSILESIYLLNKAQTWRGFCRALSLWDTPSQNFIYADRSGNIGYYLTGKIPLRDQDAALFPFPGWLERGKWRGYIEEDKKPRLYNPEEGLIITANHKIVPEDYPWYVSMDWDVPFRKERIRELLLQKAKHDIESFREIQNDIYSKRGEMFLSAFEKAENNEEHSGEALSILQKWDKRMSSGKEAALYEVFMDMLPSEVFGDELGQDFRTYDLLFRRKQAGLHRIFSEPDSPWYARKDTSRVENRNEIMIASIEKAFEWLIEEYGPKENWDWGKMHAIHFQHALGQAPLFSFFNLGSYPMPGNAFTVMPSYSFTHRTNWSASYRQIIDLSDWENSECVITTGQSGHFLSPFYDNQIPLWMGGKYHPMLFAEERIEKEAAGVLMLKPLSKKN